MIPVLDEIRSWLDDALPQVSTSSSAVKGVKASANLYSLIEIAKANGLEPYAYLPHVC